MENNPANVNVRIWEGMLKEGVPPLHVAHLISKHISELESLPDDTEGKHEALQHCRAYADRTGILKHFNVVDFDEVDAEAKTNFSKSQQALMIEMFETLEWLVQNEPADSVKRGVLVVRKLLVKARPEVEKISQMHLSENSQ